MTEKRIDWNSMMVTEEDGIKELHEPKDLQTAHEKAEHPVYFQYLEKSERTPLNPTDEAWHNPMMHVDPHLSAQDAFSSLPHWAWFDDES
ncbi:hypothetical protein JCM10450v2_005994 [Rhodotorula kratochvilovae]